MNKKFTVLLASLVLLLVGPGARQFDGSTQYANSATATGIPLTVAAWVYADNTNSVMAAGGVMSGVTTRTMIYLAGGGLPTASAVNTSGAGGSATSATPISPGEWHHLVGTFSGGSERKIWVDGVPEATNTTSITLGTLDRTVIGARITSSAVGLYWPGRIAEFGVWNVTLTAAEIASLAAGARPLRIRPSALILYCPLASDATQEPNLVGVAATLTNAPTPGAHPRIY